MFKIKRVCTDDDHNIVDDIEHRLFTCQVVNDNKSEEKAKKDEDIQKVVARAKSSIGLLGGPFCGLNDKRPVTLFLEELNTLEEYACATDVATFFTLKANLDADVNSYCSRELKRQCTAKAINAHAWQEKLELLETILITEYTSVGGNASIQHEVGQSRGVPVRDSEMVSKLYASMPEKITDWLDSLGAASTSTFIALRLELRRWARKNEKVMTPARNACNAEVQVSAEHMESMSWMMIMMIHLLQNSMQLWFVKHQRRLRSFTTSDENTIANAAMIMEEQNNITEEDDN
ncbi:hypothetical protein FOL47_010895 [Perkinsus chesapeaki]|uniref:Uncharacterized protein n=1 Tax=Perkinsus chesapeaki TaxID=330153 RepID=A0A7J6L1H5_PERCH|nr:hypothetical protein FOL47_010895 [Perkinsus chesapeaki]